MMRKFLLCGVIGVSALASAAQAATVTFQVVNTGNGTYSVVATDSQGDNAGIAAFGFDITGQTSVNVTAPQATFVNPSLQKTRMAGFFLANSQSNATTNGSSQDTAQSQSGYIGYNIGQQAGTLVTAAPGTDGYVPLFTNQAAYAVPVVVATGTFTAGSALPTLTRVQANVFTSTGSLSTTAATANIAVPEPTSLAVMALGALGLSVRRRRTA